MVVYFGPEVEKALRNYLEVRENITPLSGQDVYKRQGEDD